MLQRARTGITKKVPLIAKLYVSKIEIRITNRSISQNNLCFLTPKDLPNTRVQIKYSTNPNRGIRAKFVLKKAKQNKDKRSKINEITKYKKTMGVLVLALILITALTRISINKKSQVFKLKKSATLKIIMV